jgi:Family of unknown function (DUF6263)
MTKRILLPLGILLVTIAVSNAQKISVTKGQKLETLTTTKMTMEVMGQNIDNESNTTSEIEVKDANEKGYLFANTLKRMLIKGSAMGQDINFDSDKKEDMDGQMGQALKGRVGTTQEILVDKQGKVAATKDSASKTPGGISDVMNMTADLSKGQAYPLLIQLPAKSVKPGDTWTDSTGTAATIKTVTTYTFKGTTAAETQVSFSSTLEKNGTIEQNGMEIQLDMTGTIKGDAVYETATGLLKTTNSTSVIKGTMGVMGQSAPITANVTATVAVKKL